jgi:hypothetical protein
MGKVTAELVRTEFPKMRAELSQEVAAQYHRPLSRAEKRSLREMIERKIGERHKYHYSASELAAFGKQASWTGIAISEGQKQRRAIDNEKPTSVFRGLPKRYDRLANGNKRVVVSLPGTQDVIELIKNPLGQTLSMKRREKIWSPLISFFREKNQK